jgi:hypothetical protein
VAAVLLLATIRLSIALAGVLLAVGRGVRPAVALLTAVVGALVFGFSVISTRQGRPRRGPTPTESPWRLALRATYPSTIALTVLTAISLVLKPQLAALTAGLLAGLGLATVAAAAQLEWWRRFG